MALPETYYAVHDERDNLPDQDMWYTDIAVAKSAALADAEHDTGNTYFVTEVIVKPLFSTVAKITMEVI